MLCFEARRNVIVCLTHRHAISLSASPPKLRWCWGRKRLKAVKYLRNSSGYIRHYFRNNMSMLRYTFPSAQGAQDLLAQCSLLSKNHPELQLWPHCTHTSKNQSRPTLDLAALSEDRTNIDWKRCVMWWHAVSFSLSPSTVPQVLKSCTEFIEKHGVVDGIYRLSGIASNIQKLR